MQLLIFGIIFLLTTLLFRPKTPEQQKRTKPSLNDFDFTTRTQVRSIPILFGTAKFRGNLIYRNDLKYYEITEDGGKKRGDIVIGDRVHLTFAIAWCQNLSGVRAFYQNNTLLEDWQNGRGITEYEKLNGEWSFSAYDYSYLPVYKSYNPLVKKVKINLQTGKSRMRGGSNYGKNLTYWLGGNNNQNLPEFTSKIGENINFKNTAFTFFDDCFIGDNRQSLPEYKIVGSNFHLGVGLDDAANINGRYVYEQDVDVFFILKYIFSYFLKKNVIYGNVPDSSVDLWWSPEDYQELMYNNKIYLSFLMTSEKTAKEWINEVLKHIDGVIYFDNYKNQFVLKLIRNNYDINNCVKIDETNYNNLKVIKKDYQDLKTKITLKYTHPDTFEETSITWNNDASYNNEIKEETYDFMMCRNHETAKLILKRLIKKEAYPITAFKFQVPASLVENAGNINGNLSYNIKIGDVLNFNNNLLNISNMAIRVLEISGGKDDENFYDITASEDIFDISSFANLDFEHNVQTDINYTLSDLDSNEKILIVDTPAEMARLNNDSVIALIAENNTEELINGYMVQDGSTGNRISVGYNRSYGTLKYAVSDFKKINRESEFILENCINFKEINGSEMDFQRMKYSGIIRSSKEFICIKTITKISDTSYKITGIMRGLANTTIYNLNAGTEFYLNLSGTTANKFKSLSIIPSSSKSMYINKFNNFNISNKLLKSYTYNYTLRKPYKPCSVKYTKNLVNGTTTFTWGKNKRLAGRNYRRPELIKFGEDEGLNEDGIIYKINHNFLGNFETSSNSITLNSTVGQFKIKSFVRGYESREVIINI